MSASRPQGIRQTPATRKKMVPSQLIPAASLENSSPIAGRDTIRAETMNGAENEPSATAVSTCRFCSGPIAIVED